MADPCPECAGRRLLECSVAREWWLAIESAARDLEKARAGLAQHHYGLLPVRKVVGETRTREET